MRLLATTGPLAGTAVALSDGLTIGTTDRGTPICRVQAAEDGFVLEALEPETPVFLNGLPTTSRRLELRDEVAIGNSLFVVSDDEAQASSPSLIACAVHEGVAVDRKTLIKLAFDLSSPPELGVKSTNREQHELEVLYAAAVALSQIRGLAGLDAAVAGLLIDAVPVRRVAFADGGSASAHVRSAWSASGDLQPVMPVDVGRLAVAMRERAGTILTMGAANVLVAPMMAFGRAVGAVWAEAAPGIDLDEKHLRLLLVISALAAVAREQATETARLEETNERLRAEINLEHNMVGGSRAMRTVFDRIARVARTDSTMLIRGESGTGKELVARAAHRNSPRADRHFIAINCAALTETLLESELFGHEKGAFTGAIGLKKGKLELADGGTLFLDEIGELPLALQAKLLRALQEREFERVGGTRPLRVDFRLIAATNRDLEAAVKSGGFRQDLFYRLNVVMLALPPLRDRRDDIPALAEYFVRKHAPKCGRRVHGLHADALTRLVKYDWPGNVRELENVIEQALAFGITDRITPDDLPATLSSALRKPASQGSLNYHETIEGTKRDLILRAFEQAEHSHTVAARLLGVHPNYLHRLLRNFDLRRTLSESGETRD